MTELYTYNHKIKNEVLHYAHKIVSFMGEDILLDS